MEHQAISDRHIWLGVDPSLRASTAAASAALELLDLHIDYYSTAR